MKIIDKLNKAIKKPNWLFGVILRRCFSRMLNDRNFIKWEYFSGMGKFPDLDNPTTYNEKLQWLKLNDIHDEYTLLVDKYEAKEIVRKRIGEKYIIPTLDIYDSFDDIDFDLLPNQFVLKTTHDSGGVVVCSDKTRLDMKAVRNKLEKSLRHNYFYEHREYPYKNVKPRIIAEQYMVDESGTELKDYKFFCFDGKCKMLFVATDRQSRNEPFFNFFDEHYNPLPFKQGHPINPIIPQKPERFEEMIRIAERLSVGYRHLRVDLYNINGRIFFGELTFFHFSGNVPFEPAEWDFVIGKWLKLPITYLKPKHDKDNKRLAFFSSRRCH
ncbi:MAG: glycosyl transferase [Bacteroidaceae bacterium]|nr:glycosyl transferase [Bacteroidaceae bacterium]